MTTIYLVRHAEAEGNLYRIAHGHYNSCITDDRGCRQIRALAERFRDVPVDAVYASDLIRTRTTAQSIYLPKGLLRLRLRCGDDRQRSFWEKLGFSQVGGDVMEKNITPRVLDAHIPL